MHARETWMLRASYPLGLLAAIVAIGSLAGGDPRTASSPGPLSGPHAALQNDCARCHTVEFPEVRALLGTDPTRTMNAACLECHSAGMDYDRIQLHATHGPERTSIDDNACADCHIEHEGQPDLARVAEQRCVRCHAAEDPPIDRFESGAAASHPSFGPEPGSDPATIRFDHARHLKIGRTTCLQCHGAGQAAAPKERAKRMSPARYEPACRGCHPLTVEISGVSLDVAHGELPSAQDSLRREARAQGLAPEAVEAGLATLLAPEGTCTYCHATETRDGETRIADPQVKRRWYTKANFDHRRHLSAGYSLGDSKPERECRHCHASVLKSDEAADVSVPGIDNCRSCHGEGVRDDCATCHSFHSAPRTGPLDYDAATPEQLASGREETRFGMKGATAMWPIRHFFDLPKTVWNRPDIEPRSPEFYAEVFRRYGLFEADFDNGGLPLGLVRTTEDYEGEPGFAVTCEFCHSSSLFGEIVRGQPNPFSTMKVFFFELNALSSNRKDPLYDLGIENNTVVNAADQLGLIGLIIRQPDLSLDVPLTLRIQAGNAMEFKPEFDALAHIKTPPWYTYRTKSGGVADYYFDGGYPKNGNFSAFTYVAAYLDPSGEKLRDALSRWQIGGHEYLASLDDRAPKYPFEIDREAAARGRKVYDAECAKCHGRYTEETAAADNLIYPGIVIDLDEIGTDPLRANFPAKYAERTRKVLRDDFYPARGYVAAPLTSIWARAPYLHNGAVPTLRSLLTEPAARPRRWALLGHPDRKEDYLQDELGWKYLVLAEGDAFEHNRIHDSDIGPGLLNGGHEYGVDLPTEAKEDLLAFLRTL